MERALDVLGHLRAARRDCGVSEIGRALSLPRSTTHRLLSALRSRDLVEQGPSGRYRPGIGLVWLAQTVLEGDPVVAAARPVLEDEAARVGQTLFLAGARSGRLYVLDKEEGRGFLRASPRVGDEIPAHATAIGKLYLALVPERIARPSDGQGEDPPAFTSATLVGGALERELREVARAGFASNRDEWIAGLSGIAAPILVRGELRAALAVTGPSAAFTGAQADTLRGAVVAAAQRAAQRLSGASA